MDVKPTIVYTSISLLVEYVIHFQFQIRLAEFTLCLHVTKPSMAASLRQIVVIVLYGSGES